MKHELNNIIKYIKDYYICFISNEIYSVYAKLEPFNDSGFEEIAYKTDFNNIKVFYTKTYNELYTGDLYDINLNKQSFLISPLSLDNGEFSELKINSLEDLKDIISKSKKDIENT